MIITFCVIPNVIVVSSNNEMRTKRGMKLSYLQQENFFLYERYFLSTVCVVIADDNVIGM